MALADDWLPATELTGRLPIGRQLHDIVVPQLFVLATGLAALRRRGDEVNDPGLIGDLATTANQTLADLRSISRGNAVREGGQLSRVASRLQIATRTVAHLTGCEVAIDVAGDAQVSAALEDDIVAVAWEAVANAIRHGGADEVTITMTAADSELTVSVTDNGVWRDAGDDQGTGIDGLQQRAASWSGSAQISRVEDGTQVTWAVPLVTSVHPLASR